METTTKTLTDFLQFVDNNTYWLGDERRWESSVPEKYTEVATNEDIATEYLKTLKP